MANRWIISVHKYHEHHSLEAAQAEIARLTAAHGKKFRLYRIKNCVEPDDGEIKNGEQG